MTECPIRGEAWASITEPGVVRWQQADPAIHVNTEFLAKAGSDARAFFEATYELGEWCPYQPDCRHARRKDQL